MPRILRDHFINTCRNILDCIVGITIVLADLEGAYVSLYLVISIATYTRRAAGQYQIDDQYTQDIDYTMINERKFGYNSRPSSISRLL
jgi:hypothetical protein